MPPFDTELVKFRKITQLDVRLCPKIGAHLCCLLGFGVKPNNQYEIVDELNQFKFTALEESNCCTRQYCSKDRCISEIFGVFDTVLSKRI